MMYAYSEIYLGEMVDYAVNACRMEIGAFWVLFIPASNEPSGHACMDIWRLPRGSNTPQLCCVTSLMPRQLAAGSLTATGYGELFGQGG